MIEMKVESVRINLATQARVVILKVLEQDRYVFIWIAHAEAYAIAVHLQGTPMPRPLTHDLMKSLVEATGARVLRVVISDLKKTEGEADMFYAQVILEGAGKEVVIDARPSDAIALALRVNAPILITEQILEQVGVWLEQQDISARTGEKPEKEEPH